MTESLPPSGEVVGPLDTYLLIYRLAYLVNEILEYPYRDRTPEAVDACVEHIREVGSTHGSLLKPPHNQDELLLTNPARWALGMALQLLKLFPTPDHFRAFVAGLKDGAGFAVQECYSAGGVENLFAKTRRPVFRALRARPGVLEELETAFIVCCPSGSAPLEAIGPEQRADEEWLPASAAAQRANRAGYSITLSWLTRDAAKSGVRQRPQTLPGRHKVEVEWGSLTRYLVSNKRPVGNPQQEKDEGCGNDEAAQEIREADKRKRKDRSLD